MSGKSQNTSGWMQSWYEQWERGLAGWWDRVLDTPEVLKGMNGALAGQVEARRQMLNSGQKWMERMNLPTRQDLSRLIKIVTLVEERILGMEDRVLDLQDRLAEAERETLRARVEAAETRLELVERLAVIDARIAQVVAAAPVAASAVAVEPAPAAADAAPQRARRSKRSAAVEA